MAKEHNEKHNALEEFLEEAMSETEGSESNVSIPDQHLPDQQPAQLTTDTPEEAGLPTHSERQKGEKPNPASEAGTGTNTNQNNSKTSKTDPEEDRLLNRLGGLTSSALQFAKKTTKTSLKVGKAIIHSQDQLKLMLAAGQSLKDLREVAGLTVSEMNDALNLKDKSLLEAVENGTSTLSFELILRLSALLARNDPIPFIIKYTRTYNPEIWKILSDWGLGRIPLQYEREREFINIFRAHDEARKLSDDGYKKVLEFTQKAFDMSLHFIAEQEHIGFDEEKAEDASDPK